MIVQGAEAVVTEEGKNIVKTRLKKNYRKEELDKSIRQFRTRRETKILKKIEGKISAPKIIESCDKEMRIVMTKIDGKKVKDVIENNTKISKQIGENVGKLHEENIIHSDLTTSNMIYDGKVNMIDFGLSFFSHKIEDKAVDLLMFKRALKSAHHSKQEKIWTEFLKGYKTYSESKNVLERLENVEQRGRNKIKT